MVDIIVILRSGAERRLKAEHGISLMEALRDAGVADILALCGGSCSCATCHVHVDPAWREIVGPPGAFEAELLGCAANAGETSRLSCQIPVSDALNGLRVTVAAED